MIKKKIDKNIKCIKLPSREDDPKNPDINLAKNLLDWYPKITLDEGLELTINI